MKDRISKTTTESSANSPRKDSAIVLDRLATAMGPIRNEGLTQHVIRELKRCILQRLVRPGERLPPERELAGLFGISRGSLRQALRALQVMGVLEIIHGSGAYLSQAAETILRDPDQVLVPLRGHSFAEMYEARRAMEAESAATAATRAMEQDIARMRAEIRAMRSSARNVQRFLQHDRAFHRNIALASGNSVFLWFIELLQKVLVEGQISHARMTQFADVIAEHERIVEAIEAGQAERARAEMLAHLTLNKAYTDKQTGVELRVFSEEQ
jgi:GntR family transcriptional repressor for pyruvate dehydrogenase complex